MDVTSTAHNIRLDDGTFTKLDQIAIHNHPWFLSAQRLLESIFPGTKAIIA
jgi:hypothetical protein